MAIEGLEESGLITVTRSMMAKGRGNRRKVMTLSIEATAKGRDRFESQEGF